MNANDKWWTTGAVVVGVIILYFLLHKSGVIVPAAPFTINLPGPPAPPPPVNYVVNVPNGAVNTPQAPGTGCSCNGENPLFTSLATMINAEAQRLAQIEESYLSGIEASLPDWFAQNLNNVEGAYLSGASVQTLFSLA